MKSLLKPAAAAALMLAAMPAGAVPARQVPRTFTQPDGSTITLTLVGDEFCHFYQTENGDLVLPDKAGAYRYAVIGADGTLVPGTEMAGQTMSRAARLNRADAADAIARTASRGRERRALRADIPATTAAPQQRIPDGRNMLFSDVPAMGEQPGLVILVEYSNYSFQVADPAEYFERFMNEPGFSDNGATGSARDFFLTSSRGQFRPHFDVYGPVTLNQPRSYYGGNDWSGSDEKPEMMAVEAIQYLDDEGVDFSQYDTDGDGFIDNVTIIYAGQGEASGGPAESVWPHSWNVYKGAGIKVTVDGVTLDRYNCINEWQNGRPDGIGTFCHEFSHVLGLPDEYATDYGSARDLTPGMWSVMDIGPYNNDGNTPPLHSAFEAYCLGWVTPEIVTSPVSAVLAGSGSGQCYAMETDKNNEFYIFENRTDDVVWDSFLPGHGMLIWHIDYLKSAWDRNMPNNQRTNQRIDLVEADGVPGTQTAASDWWPGQGGVYSEFSDETFPAFQSNSKMNMEQNLYNIARDNQNGEVTFDFGEGGGTIEATSNPGGAAQGTHLDLEWDAVDGAVAYEVNVYNNTEGIFEPGCRGIRVEPSAAASRAGKVTHTVMGLSEDTEYRVSIRTVGASARSPWSSEVSLTTGKPGSIETIGSDDTLAPAEYFNFQGVRVSRPQPGSIVIRRQGTQASKILVK